jgi:hypothetical protein
MRAAQRARGGARRAGGPRSRGAAPDYLIHEDKVRELVLARVSKGSACLRTP